LISKEDNQLAQEKAFVHRLAHSIALQDEKYYRELFRLVSHLFERIKQGHVFLDLQMFATSPAMTQTMQTAIEQSKIIGSKHVSLQPLVLHRHRLFFYRHWAQELVVANYVLEKIKILHTLSEEAHEDNYRIVRNGEIDKQNLAIISIRLNSLTILTGGPGTGKTSTIARAVSELSKQQSSTELRIALAAPTGKAAMRMREAFTQYLQQQNLNSNLQVKVTTIHRLLAFSPSRNTFLFNRERTLIEDVVIIDEASMLDLQLLTHLLAALKTDSKLILVGDKDQLASIESGAVLRDLCSFKNGFSARRKQILEKLFSQSLPLNTCDHALSDCIIELDKSYRFSSSSSIAQLTQAIRTDDYPAFESIIISQTYADFAFIDLNNAANSFLNVIIEDYIALYSRTEFSLNQFEKALSTLSAYKVLCASKEGNFGVDTVNHCVEQALKKHYHLDYSSVWYPGKQIIINRNNYDLDIYNGDIGVCISTEDKHLEIVFPDSEVGVKRFHPSQLTEYDLAYAITVHKSQGSEYEHVFCLFPNHESKLMTKELVYTAITRAKNRLSIAAKLSQLVNALRKRIERDTDLKEKISDLLKQNS